MSEKALGTVTISPAAYHTGGHVPGYASGTARNCWGMEQCSKQEELEMETTK